LPPAPSIQNDLLAIGLSTELMEQLLEMYSQKCKEIQTTIEKHWAKFSCNLTTLPVHPINNPLSLSDKCAEMYRDRYSRGVEDCAERILRHARVLHTKELKDFDESNTKGPRFQPVRPPLIGYNKLLRIDIGFSRSDHFSNIILKKIHFPIVERRKSLPVKRGWTIDKSTPGYVIPIFSYYTPPYLLQFQNRRARARRDGEQMKHRNFYQQLNSDQGPRGENILKTFHTQSDEGDVDSNDHSTSDVASDDDEVNAMCSILRFYFIFYF
jgi:hypothetical protein